MIIAVLGWRNMGPAEPSCPFVRRSGRACFLLCLRDTDSLRLSRKRRARRSWSGPGPNVVCEDVRLACPGESCVPNANGCRSRRFPSGAKGNYIYFHVQACPPLPEFPIYYINLGLRPRVRIRLGFCHEIPSVGKDFLGEPETSET